MQFIPVSVVEENFDPFVIVLLGSVDEGATVHLGTGLAIEILCYCLREAAKKVFLFSGPVTRAKINSHKTILFNPAYSAS